jgi:hypothetical protein
MKLQIATVRPATSLEWDEIWQECDYATYFHSREWAEIWNIYTDGKMYPDPKLIIFNDKKKGLLPLSHQKSLRGLVKNYISSPAGTFGGWISKDELTAEHSKLLSSYLIRKHRNLIWRLNPYDKTIGQNGIKITNDDKTHALNLSHGFDAIYKKWTKNNGAIVRKARKACKEGVSIRHAVSLEDWKNYFRVYEDCLKRWAEKATSRYRWTLFEEIFKRNSHHIKLWLSFYQEKAIAGALVFFAKKHAVYWHGAALEQYFNLRPVNLLMYEAVKNACEQGYTWFDFNPSGGHEGVLKFKKSFGTQELSSPVVNIQSKVTKLTTFSKRLHRTFKNKLTGI